ncbi:ABC-type transport system, involved in lipoprotein release, permease component [Promicromonospora umidemergens]|uniref:ABC transporter permease n=1 Tax=Promicromonospora umidemergens TaxID=629679 RepID=A0ABP8WEZ1_9MICO|nr:ABC transporter permease [Promicromonospora umidemergens]MCP2284368.1 ABC-type transport system, involved in lipoprotein release, permease component [Promicromonospora umidemergens]
MFFTYLRRELRNRRKQTIVVAIGLSVAIALVIVVSSVSTGVKNAQSEVLESVYGVGTDITVTQPAGGPGEGAAPARRFDFGEEDGEASEDGTRSLAQDRLSTAMGSTSFDAAALETVSGLDHVSGVAATLDLQNMSFSGEMPDMEALQEGDGPATLQMGPDGAGEGSAGGSSFEIEQFTVTGVDPDAAAVGPLTTAEVADGRTLAADDENVAVLDATYAEQQGLAVGDTITAGGKDLEIVGTVASSTGDGVATASDAYLPLATAQTLADLADQVTDVYVQVDSAENVDAVAAAVEDELPDASVSTQSDLAEGVTGSLSTASNLIGTLGTWLSAIVLAAAFGLAILFTVSGVNRRTRELGTLKAIGWSKGRVVGQVAGESVVQGLIGGAAGLALGALAVWAVNLSGITLSGASGGFTMGGGTGPMSAGAVQGGDTAPEGAGGSAFGERADTLAGAAGNAVDVVLQAPVSLWIVLAAVGLAVLGGLLAGVVGGQRAARLRPAEALRSLA